MNYVNHNGKLLPKEDALVPADNNTFRYGYGLFETMLVQEGDIMLGQYHMERLFGGMKQLLFELPALMTADLLTEQVLVTARKNNMERLCRVRLQVYAGGGGLFSREANRPGYVIECFGLEPTAMQLNENGLVAGIAEGISKSTDSLSNLKSCNGLIYAMAAKQAMAHKWNDALICNTHGNIAESSIANVFWVKDGCIYTPPLSEGCVAGVMRRHLMEKTAIEEKPFSMEDLYEADEIFLTNAIKRMKWVGIAGKRQLKNALCKSIYESVFLKVSFK